MLSHSCRSGTMFLITNEREFFLCSTPRFPPVASPGVVGSWGGGGLFSPPPLQQRAPWKLNTDAVKSQHGHQK